MPNFLLISSTCRYFVLRLTTPNPENAVVEVTQVKDIEWAERQGVLTCIKIVTSEDELATVLDLVPYLRVDAWPKYYFPTFHPVPNDPELDSAYQWYGIEEMEEMLFLVKQCLALAEQVAGVRVGSR
jgi:hypothetical protein